MAMKNFTLRLSEKQYKELNEKAAQEKLPVSFILRRIIDRYLDEK